MRSSSGVWTVASDRLVSNPGPTTQLSEHLGLIFLFCKMGTLGVPSLWGCCRNPGSHGSYSTRQSAGLGLGTVVVPGLHTDFLSSDL